MSNTAPPKPTRQASAPAPKVTPSSAQNAPTKASTAQLALAKLGLVRPIDFALHIPLRYEDETQFTLLGEASPGETIQICAVVLDAQIQFRGRRQLLVTVADASERCTLRFLNFYPSHQKTMLEGARLRIRGELRQGPRGLEMMHPSFKLDAGELPTSLTPIYSTVARLPQAYIRKAVYKQIELADLSPTLPPEVEAQIAHKLPLSLEAAIRFLHFPPAQTAIAEIENRSHPAWQRLKAEELLAQQLSQLQARSERSSRQAPDLSPRQSLPTSSLTQQLRELLPFELTAAQERVFLEIARDLGRRQPMNRLLQGDVGSGKTVVAALAAAHCIEATYQCALMVPTEILAQQHFKKLSEWMQALGVEVAWLAASQKKKERAEMLERIASGSARLIVGTHAVISANVVFDKLGLVIIDEQHRFGVAQRLALRHKGEAAHKALEPHLLMMSATPIPRTLAMSYYADLDVSTIDMLPAGRTPIVTKLVSEERKLEIVERIRKQIAQGRQVYWVCPLIEESEALDLANATATHAQLQEWLGAGVHPASADEANHSKKLEGFQAGPRVGLLHSRMPPIEKQMVMDYFVKGRIQVLVATTVIEVGVDVPNASLMVIEHAERFGLSQLHQLRGRVGRGVAASACILLYSKGEHGRLGDNAKQRLQAMLESADGFEIARRDLEIRGPGEFLGARQAGHALLRFADLKADVLWLEWARQTAPTMLTHHPEHSARHIGRWLGDKTAYLQA